MARRNVSPSGIYVIRCEANGRVYVGSSVNILNRWRMHRRELNAGNHHSSLLQRSWSKYGSDTFTWTIVEVVQDNNILVAAEQKWINLLKSASRDHGFNISPTAGSPIGIKRSKEYIESMRAKLTGRKLSPEHRAAVSEGLRHRAPPTPETRAAIAASHRGIKHSPERKAAISAAHKGKVLSAEHRAALSKAGLGRKFSEESKAKMSAAKLGKKHTPETIARMSASQSTPELQAARSARWLGRKHTQESLAKMRVKKSAAHRAALSKAARGRKLTPETRMKISLTKQQKFISKQSSLYFDLFENSDECRELSTGESDHGS